MGGEMKIKPGDRVKVKIATRNGWIRGWRIVRKVLPNRHGTIEIRAHGYSDFQVRPYEIMDWKAKI